MANHKYKNTSNQRAGCKLCKPWKINGNHNGWMASRPVSDRRALQDDLDDEVAQYYEEVESYYEEGPNADFIENVLPFLIEYNVQ